MKYKAVGFDYGGVLNGATGSTFNEAAVKVLGVTMAEFKTAYFRHNKKVNRDEVTWPELWKLVLTDLGQPEKVEQILALSDTRGSDSLNLDVVEVAKQLKQNGYIIGILSNNQAAALDQMKEQQLDEIFPVIDISAITGLVKPEPEAFISFAERLGVDVSEMIFIDDSEKSLSTADEVGFTPVRFTTCEKLKNDLAKLGIQL